MKNDNQIIAFQNKKIRRHWDEKKEKWYFSIVDIVAVLTDSGNPTDYLKKLRKRDFELGVYIETNCPQVEMITNTGKNGKHWRATRNKFLDLSSLSPVKKPSHLSYGLPK